MTPDAALVDTAELARVDAWWRAANYLSVGQIYLLDNPLLLEPLRAEHIKARLLGPQRLEQERVVEQVDLADREVVGRPPPGIDPGELSCVNEGCIWCHRQSSGHHRRPAASS